MNNTEALIATTQARFEASCEVPKGFFEAESEKISQACFAMAQRFHRGGRLLVFGSGSCATDAQHVSVEFVHPVIVGKRALPAIAVTNDVATTLAWAAETGLEHMFAKPLETMARSEDIALGITRFGNDPATLAALDTARQKGMLTLALAGGDGGLLAKKDYNFSFITPSPDPFVVQETQETLYHILWELVHVFFEHKGLLDERDSMEV